MIVIYDNANIHKTKKVKILMKKLKWMVFKFLHILKN